MYVCVYILYIYVYVYVYIYIHVYIYMRVYIYVCVCIYRYLYIYIYIDIDVGLYACINIPWPQKIPQVLAYYWSHGGVSVALYDLHNMDTHMAASTNWGPSLRVSKS